MHLRCRPGALCTSCGPGAPGTPPSPECDHSSVTQHERPLQPVIGILHPGEMGASVGAALGRSAGEVVWASAGRSRATRARAEQAALVDVGDLSELCRRADVIVAVCPPGAALDVAVAVAAALGDRPDRPLYVDANAVSPATVRSIAHLFGADHVVDGGIIGPPAWKPGRTTMWLSGIAAPFVAALFDGSPMTARTLDGGVGSASALKACFALHSKALPTIWLATAEAAQAFGVQEALRDQLRQVGIDLDVELGRVEAKASGKAWRWIVEMNAAGDAFAAAGVPDGFSRAAAEMYRRMADRAGAARDVDVDDVDAGDAGDDGDDGDSGISEAAD